jgi:hypothetical protein
MTTRALLLGFESGPKPKQDESLTDIRIHSYSAGYNSYRRFEPAVPTAYDYHIVVVSKEAVDLMKDDLTKKKDDLVSLMSAPFRGTLVVPIIGGNRYYDDWVPTIDKLKESTGDFLKLRERHWAYHFMKKYQESFSWKAHSDFSITSYNDSLAQRFIATNLADNPVAFESPMGNGRTIYLPCYNFPDGGEEILFLRDLLDCIENRYKVPTGREVPSWGLKPDYRLPTEAGMDEQARSIEKQRTTLNRIKSILWLDGIELVDSVWETFTKLGIRCEVKEKERRHDLEIIEPELHAIVEVKGLSGYANDEPVRQLLDWWTQAAKQDDDVKGVLIVNDFKDIEPKLRQNKLNETIKGSKHPFTANAEKIAIGMNFCLLTCNQLFEMVKLDMSGKFDKLGFLRKLKNTKGVFQL